MVKKNREKITNNDDFPPLPPRPPAMEIPTPTDTGQENDSSWTTVRSRKGKVVSPTVSKIQLPNLRCARGPSKVRQ